MDSVKLSDRHILDNGYIGLVDIKLSGLPDTLEVNGHSLLKKSELHISLACIKLLAPMIDTSRTDALQTEMAELFKEFIKTTPLTDFELTNEYRLVKRDQRVTVIAMVTVPGIKDFFKLLQDKYAVELPLQPTHITLYTLQPDTGIGLLSTEVVEKESEPVQLDLKITKA